MSFIVACLNSPKNLDEKERYRADLKTIESVRTIPMSPEVEKILRHYILKWGLRNVQFLFLNRLYK